VITQKKKTKSVRCNMCGGFCLSGCRVPDTGALTGSYPLDFVYVSFLQVMLGLILLISVARILRAPNKT
jgi:hypothetical protein